MSSLNETSGPKKVIQRDPFGGIGEPEPPKHGLSGWWSRRIDKENRIVYQDRRGYISSRAGFTTGYETACAGTSRR